MFCGCDTCMDETFISARTWKCKVCSGLGVILAQDALEAISARLWEDELIKFGLKDDDLKEPSD